MIMTYYIINDYFELLIEEHIYKEREKKNRNHFMCVCARIYVFHSANYYSYFSKFLG